jgi:hypothetical protein
MSTLEEQIILFRTRQYPIQNPYLLNKQQRKALDEKLSVFNSIITEFPEEVAKDASESERERRDFGALPDSTLTYGEIDFVSVGEIFETLKNRFQSLPEGGVFYDLGSGSGKGVVAAALLGKFSQCKGIELLESLFSLSLSMKSKFESMKESLLFDQAHLFDDFPGIQFFCSDFFQFDWTDADMILANSTCFSDEMMIRLGEVELKTGTIAISLTQKIPGKNWIILETIRKDMSWGVATVHMQKYVGSLS